MAQKKNELVSVNLLPISILLAAIIISATILFSQNDSKNADTDNTDNNNDQTADGDFPEAETNIDDDPIIGDPNKAKVAIVEFSEYRCSYCNKYTDETYSDVIKNFVDTGDAVYVFRDYQMFGELSEEIAKIGACVYEKSGIDDFVSYHKDAFLLESTDAAYEIVTGLGLNKTEIETCAAKDSLNDELAKDLADGSEAGVSGTPAFIIGTLSDDGTVNGVLISGAYPYASFEEVINSYLD